jgi:hypothetical protein
MQNLRVSSLQWAAGVLCSLIGAVLLVIPHQFEFPGLWADPNLLFAWGGGGVPPDGGCPAQPGRAGALLSLAWMMVRVDSWIGTINFGMLGLGLVISSRLPGACH